MPISVSLSSVTKAWVLLCCRRPAFFATRTSGPENDQDHGRRSAMPSSAMRQEIRNARPTLTAVSRSEAMNMVESM